MKKTTIIFTLFVSIVLTSCFKDLGNYDYSDKEVITITGIATSYNAVQMVDSLTITPTVTSNKPGADFEYYYALYETNVQGYAPVLDTIQRSGKNLVKYPITRKSMTYGLIFMAKNKTTGVTGFFSSTLNVVTKFNNGWYVLKDQNNICDLDLFDSTSTLVIPNVLLSVNGRQLKGRAQALSFASNYSVYDPVMARFVNTKTLFPVSDEDAKAVIFATAVIAKDFPDLFYDDIVEPYAPTRVFANSQGNWITNKGRAFSIYTMSSNAGMFGAESPIDVNYTPYRLSKYSVNHSIYGPLCFDEISSTFVLVPYGGSQLVATTNATGSNMPVKNNNKNLLYMGSKGSSGSYFFAVMQDKTNTALKFLSRVEGFTSSTGPALKFINDTLSQSDLAYSASTYTSSQSLDILYFVNNNKLYMRNMASKGAANVAMSFTIPAGETVTFIKHVPAYSTTIKNNFMLATQSGTRYKVRVFNLTTTGDITGAPVYTFEGNGRAGDIMFVYPNLSNNYYPCTY